MGIYSEESRVGYSHTLRESRGESVNILEETKLRMNVLGSDQALQIKSNYLLNGYSIREFDFSMLASSMELRASGKREGNDLKIRVSSVSGTSEISLPVDDETLVMPIVFKWLSQQSPEVGRTYEIKLFDPALVLMDAAPRALKATLGVVGKEKIKIPLGSFETFKIETSFAGADITTWITETGEVIKELSTLGLVAIREPGERISGQALSSFDILEKTAISSKVSLDNARSLKLLRVKMEGADHHSELDLQDGNRQSYRDGLIEVRVEDLSGLKTYAVPYSDKRYDSYLKHTNLIQSNNEEIIMTARRIIEGEKDSLRAVKRITRWVHDSIEKAPTISVPNALDVLKTKKGDCNEHATLFAALSRAAGIPTKIVLGVVFLESKFYYHAWNEVFVGDWVSVDSTFGQVPADAAHIKFIEGDLGKSTEIMKMVGKVKLEIIEAS